MQSATLRTLTLTCALCVLGACSQGAAPAQDGAATDPVSTSAAPSPGDTGGGNASRNPCDVITAADVAGILTAPATSKPVGGPGTCMYQTQSKANVTINVAQGDSARGAWMLATTYNATKTPLAGVGDEALHDSTGTTLIARKGDTSCRVDVVGYDNSDAMDSITKDRGEILARKLGALCSKIFSFH